MKKTILKVITIVLMCYLPGLIGGLACESKYDSIPQEDSEFLGEYKKGELVFYDAPKEIRMWGQGKCIIVKSGKHPAEILKYHSGPNTYTIGIEIESGILFEVKYANPSRIYKLQ